jgi:hypothetical protein
MDGAFEKAGFDLAAIVECHGSIHYLQPLERRSDDVVVGVAGSQLPALVVDMECMSSMGDLPIEKRDAKDVLARPNIFMFNDREWVGTLTNEQVIRMFAWAAAIAPDSMVVIIELEAGTAIPTVRLESEGLPCCEEEPTLICITPREPEPDRDEHELANRFIPLPMSARAALEAIQEAMT